MGNSIAGSSSRKKVRIMKIDGQTFKLRPLATAADVLGDYSEDHVLMNSDAVKKFGIRAPKLPPWEELKPGKTYFLVEMPKFPDPALSPAARMGRAEKRLEGLRLRQKRDPGMDMDTGSGSGSVRVKMRVPRARIVKLMEESRDEAQVAEKIVHLCLEA